MESHNLDLNQVVVQKWEESERGWGTRPDGYSLHLSFEGLRKYISDYWDSMPDSVPDEYSKPDGTPYIAEVDESTFNDLQEAENLRIYWGEYPGDGGVDGWKNLD